MDIFQEHAYQALQIYHVHADETVRRSFIELLANRKKESIEDFPRRYTVAVTQRSVAGMLHNYRREISGNGKEKRLEKVVNAVAQAASNASQKLSSYYIKKVIKKNSEEIIDIKVKDEKDIARELTMLLVNNPMISNSVLDTIVYPINYIDPIDMPNYIDMCLRFVSYIGNGFKEGEEKFQEVAAKVAELYWKNKKSFLIGHDIDASVLMEKAADLDPTKPLEAILAEIRKAMPEYEVVQKIRLSSENAQSSLC